MGKFLILITIWACCMLTGCSGEVPFAPDRLFLTNGGKSLLAANHSGKALWKLHPDSYAVEKKVAFDTPVTDLTPAPDHRLWVVCEGNGTNLYELSADLSVISQTAAGHTPSSIAYNPRTKSLWLALRYEGELREIDPSTRKMLARIPVGREPVDVIPFAADSLLLVAANLPEMSALSYPVAARLSVVDAVNKQVVGRIPLPNGSTDVKSIATDATGSYAYVTHLVGRYQLPTSQVDRGWMSTNALSIINLQTEALETTVLLDTPQKGAANPWEVTVSPDNRFILVAASGVHELVRIDREALHERLAKVRAGGHVTPSTRRWEDIPDDAGFLYGIRDFIATGGKGPRSVVAGPQKSYVANYFTGEITCVDAHTGDKTVSHPLGSPLIATEAGKGNMYFHDASLCFQGWQSCASCHPNDARIDGLNWDLLNDGMGNPKNTKTLLLSHQTPPCMATGIRKNAETAVRSGIKYILFSQGNEAIAKAMDTYLESLVPVSSPYLQNGQLSEKAQRGKLIFNQQCASCHGGAYYTDRKQYAISWATGPDAQVKMDVPALNEVWRTAPYLYDGRCATMEEMLQIHGAQQPLTADERGDLACYVLSL